LRWLAERRRWDRWAAFLLNAKPGKKVLDSYPGTVYASQAKERLSQMQRPQEAAAGIEHSR